METGLYSSRGAIALPHGAFDATFNVTADIAALSEEDLQNPAYNFLAQYRQAQQAAYAKGIKQVLNLFHISSSGLDLIKKGQELGEKFKVVIPAQFEGAFKNGEAFLGKNSPLIYLKGKQGIKGHVKIREFTGLEKCTELSASLQMIAVQAALMQITQQLERIEQHLVRIHEEFNIDRVGMIQAGYFNYLIAQQTQDAHLRDSLLTQANSQLSQGRSQLMEATKRQIKELSRGGVGFWSSLRHELFTLSSYEDKKKKQIEDIQKNLFYIQRASQVIVSIFEELNEPAGLVQSLAPYNNLVTIMAETENLPF